MARRRRRHACDVIADLTAMFNARFTDGQRIVEFDLTDGRSMSIGMAVIRNRADRLDDAPGTNTGNGVTILHPPAQSDE